MVYTVNYFFYLFFLNTFPMKNLCNLFNQLNVRSKYKRVPAKFLALLEELEHGSPHILLLGHDVDFWDLFATFAMADERSGILVLLLANIIGIRGCGLLKTRERICTVVVHAGLGGSDGHVGGRHFIFKVACENQVFMVKCIYVKCPGSNDNHFIAFLKNIKYLS